MGFFQARILEWVAIPFSRGSSWPRDWTHISWIGRHILYHWATWEAPESGDLRSKPFAGRFYVVLYQKDRLLWTLFQTSELNFRIVSKMYLMLYSLLQKHTFLQKLSCYFQINAYFKPNMIQMFLIHILIHQDVLYGSFNVSKVSKGHLIFKGGRSYFSIRKFN